MPKITKEQLRAKLRERDIAPVYVLSGSEAVIRDVAAKTIADLSFGKEDFRDFNEDIFSLSSPETMTAALAAAEQLPMMAARRVIRVTDVRIGATSQRDTLKEDYEEVLGTYLANPAPQTVLIFTADELNANRKISKLLIKHAVVVEFENLQGRELIKWIVSTAAENEALIDDRTAQHLAAMTGPDLRRLSTELKKLAAAALPEKLITVDHIDDLVSQTAETSNFDLTDHLVAGRSQMALQAMKKILDDGAEPLALLGLISYNFRRLLAAQSMMASGADRSEVAKVVKLRYDDQEKFLAAARRADHAQLTAILKKLNEVDLAIKTSLGGGGKTGSRMQIEMLVSEIATSAKRSV